MKKQVKITIEENENRITYADKFEINDIKGILDYIEYFKKQDDMKIIDISIEKI